MPSRDDVVGCPVCGFPDFAAFDEKGLTTFEICPCCTNQSGYDYDGRSNADRFLTLRKQWVLEFKGRWRGAGHPPSNWSFQSQLAAANLDIE